MCYNKSVEGNIDNMISGVMNALEGLSKTRPKLVEALCRLISVLYDRHKQYKGPIQFSGLARMLSCLYGEGRFQSRDIPLIMILLKVSRISSDPNDLDSWIDVAGYAMLGAEILSSFDNEKQQDTLIKEV